MPPVGKAVTVLLTALDDGVPSALITETAIVSPAVCPYTPAGTATVADPAETTTLVTSATVEPPSENRTVIVSVMFETDSVKFEAAPAQIVPVTEFTTGIKFVLTHKEPL